MSDDDKAVLRAVSQDLHLLTWTGPGMTNARQLFDGIYEIRKAIRQHLDETESSDDADRQDV